MNEPTKVLEYAELPCLSNFSPLCRATRPEELDAGANELDNTALTMVSESAMAEVVSAPMTATGHELQLLIGSQLQDQCDARCTLVVTACDLDDFGYLGEFITDLNYCVALNEHCGGLRLFQARLASDDVARYLHGSFA